MCKVNINENGLTVEGGELEISQPSEVGEKIRILNECKLNGNPVPIYLKNFAEAINKSTNKI